MITSFTTIEPIWVFIIGILISIIPYLTEKSIIFGVRIPMDKINSDIIKKMKKTYVSITLILTIILTVITYLLSPYLFVIAFMPLFMVLIEFMVYLPEHYSLERVKRREHWEFKANSVTGIFNFNNEKKFPWFFAIPGILVIISIFVTGALDYKSIPERFATHYNANGVANAYSTKSIESVFILGFISIIITIMMVLIAYAIARTPLKADNASSYGSERATMFRERMVYLTLLTPVFINSSLLTGSLGRWGIIKENILLILIPVFLLLIFVIIISIKTGQMGSNIKMNGELAGNNISDNKNDDSLWKAGVIYYNKNDSRIMVPKRFGVGYTVNFGNTAGKLILILPIAAVIIIVVVSFYIAGII